MRIIGSLVVKNEVDRYLGACLEHMAPLVDELFIYDDQSTDGTADICMQVTSDHYVRHDSVPSFVENEGAFRQAAWDKMIEALSPEPGDFILSFDADEFLVSLSMDTRDELEFVVDSAARRYTSILLPVPEIFDIVDGIPQQRIDGLWGKIAGTRLFKYRDGGVFREKRMGCGSEPSYVASSPAFPKEDHSLHLMHFGYAKKEDQISKHQRYTSLVDHGHDNAHVQSIIGPKTLIPWEGPIPHGIA